MQTETTSGEPEKLPVSTSVSSIHFKQFSNLGPGKFRVVWFGNIKTSYSLSRVAVVFSPYRAASKFLGARFDYNNRYTVLLPVSFLRAFRIGDIWEDGSPTGQRDIQSEEVFDLDIQEGNTSVVPVGIPIAHGDEQPQYALPFSEFVGHQDFTHAQCVRVPLEDGTLVIVPCMEIIRFYFGASGLFLKRLFSGAYALDDLYSDAFFTRGTGKAHIKLATDLPGSAASTVARIAFDPHARNAARWIVNSNVAAAANGKDYHPRTSFPFRGRTQLSTRGRWLGKGSQRSFLVEQIVSCTQPFPFEELFYTTSRSVVDGEQDSNGPYSNSPRNQKTKHQDFKTPEFTDASVSSKLLYAQFPVDLGDQVAFPDLENKKVLRIKEEKQGFRKSRRTDPSMEFGAGSETSLTDVRGAELTTEMEAYLPMNTPPESVEIFEDALEFGKQQRPDQINWQLLGQIDNAALQENPGQGDTSDCDNTPIWAGVVDINRDGRRCAALVLVGDTLEELSNTPGPIAAIFQQFQSLKTQAAPETPECPSTPANTDTAPQEQGSP